jgi:hypothetical protein
MVRIMRNAHALLVGIAFLSFSHVASAQQQVTAAQWEEQMKANREEYRKFLEKNQAEEEEQKRQQIEREKSAIIANSRDNNKYGDDSYQQACASQRQLRAVYLKNKPEFMQLAICYYGDDIKKERGIISGEYALARSTGGGIIDKSYIYDQQELIRRDIVLIGRLKHDIKSHHYKRISCSAYPMKTTLLCLSDIDNKPKECSNENFSIFSWAADLYFKFLVDEYQHVQCPDDPYPFAEDGDDK